MKKTKTSYEVDLTVEPLHTLAAVGGAQLPAQGTSPLKRDQGAKDVGQQQEAHISSTSPPIISDGATGKGKVKPAKEGKNSKKGKKTKGKLSSSSESSSSSSSSSSASSDSDEDFRSTRGMRHALEAWRYPFYTPSASYRQLDALAGSHQYTISGYSLARAMGCGTRLCSDFFEVAGQAFRLEVYPAGFTADTRKYITVFLTTPGTPNPNHIMFDISILDQSGKDKHISSKHIHGGRHQQGPMVAHTRGVVGAVLRLAKCKHLENKHRRYLPHDMLALRATVHVLRGWSSLPTVHPHSASMLMPPQTLLGPVAAPNMPPLVNAWYNSVMPGTGLLGMAAPVAHLTTVGVPGMPPAQPLGYTRTDAAYSFPVYQQPATMPLVQFSHTQQHPGFVAPPTPITTMQPVAPAARIIAAPSNQACSYGAPCLAAMQLS